MSNPYEVTPGTIGVWHGGELLFECDAKGRRCPSEGEFLRHHGTTYFVTKCVTFYSASIDGYDINVTVEPVRMFHWVFSSHRDIELATQAAKESGLSDCAYIASACRMKATIEPILRENGERADQLRQLLGIEPGPGCGVIE